MLLETLALGKPCAWRNRGGYENLLVVARDYSDGWSVDDDNEVMMTDFEKDCDPSLLIMDHTSFIRDGKQQTV